MIGMLLPDPGLARLPFQNGIFEALRKRLGHLGIRIETHVSASCYSQHPERALAKLLASHPADAWLLVHTSPVMQRWFARNRVPCVLSGSCAADTSLPSVDIDHAAATRHAVGVLTRAGRRNIALISPKGDRQGDLESEAEFQAAIQASSTAVNALIVHHDDSVPGLLSALKTLLSRKAPADAMIIARPSYALLVLTHLQKMARRIPQDVALIARTDDPMLNFATPRISCYHADAAVYGRQLADGLAKVLASGFGSQHRVRQLPIFMPGETI